MSFPIDNIDPQLITNGQFDQDSDWIKGAGWTIAGGEAHGNLPVRTQLKQACDDMVINTPYFVSVDFIFGPSLLFLETWIFGTREFFTFTTGHYEAFITSPANPAQNECIFEGQFIVVDIDNISIINIGAFMADSYGFQPSESMTYETWDLDVDYFVVQINDWMDHTNQLFKILKADLDPYP